MSQSSSLETTPAASPTPLPPIKRSDILSRLVRLCLKEFREILRDRRTIITLVAMPILVYPLLSLVFSRFVLTTLVTAQQETLTIGFRTEDEQAAFQSLISDGHQLLEQDGEDTSDLQDKTFGVAILGSSLLQAQDEGAIQVAIYIDPDSPPRSPRWKIRLLQGDSQAASVERSLTRRLDRVNRFWFAQILGRIGRPLQVPADFQTSIVKSESGPPVSLASFIPLMLLLMTITGAVYPAIDLTAGERERGTLEALIAAPIPRAGLLVAKYVTVLFVAMLTAIANLSAMLITIYVGQLESLVFGDRGLTFDVVIQVFGLLVLFAAFFSAVLLAVTSFARSFKEAQAYLIPLMLLTIAPGILSLAPSLTIEGPLAAAPLVNITLMARDIFDGSINPAWGMVVIATTSLYAMAALAIAAQIFGTDAVLYGSSTGWREFLSRPLERANTASLSSALSCLAVLFIAFFVSVGILRRIQVSPLQQIVIAGVAQAVIFLVIPLLFAGWLRLRFRPAFGTRFPPLLSFVAALGLGVSMWTIAHELVLLNELLGWVDLAKSAERVKSQLEQWRSLPVFLPVLVFGVLPAISEEVFFRGLLFRSLFARGNAWLAILVSSLAFAAFHVVNGTLLTPERFFPSLFAGLVLGVLAWRFQSIWPGMLAHAVHNSGLLLLAYYQPQVDATLKSWNWAIDDQAHLPWPLLAVGGGLVLGTLLISWLTYRSESPDDRTALGRDSVGSTTNVGASHEVEAPEVEAATE
ncbi:MAG: CPBP family intramembrane metalloprotease [Planctomycetales bacterium]|nr:CPBP family intramembrane metalloprotease [Planctomycetales bacterium]